MGSKSTLGGAALPSAGFFPPTLPPEVDPIENEVVLGRVSDVKVDVEFVTPLVSVVEECDKSGDMISVQLYAGQAVYRES